MSPCVLHTGVFQNGSRSHTLLNTRTERIFVSIRDFWTLTTDIHLVSKILDELQYTRRIEMQLRDAGEDQHLVLTLILSHCLVYMVVTTASFWLRWPLIQFGTGCVKGVRIRVSVRIRFSLPSCDYWFVEISLWDTFAVACYYRLISITV